MNVKRTWSFVLALVVYLLCVEEYASINWDSSFDWASSFVDWDDVKSLIDPIGLFGERCTESYVIPNPDALARMKFEVYGQHIAMKVVPNAITRHWNDPKPKKSLVMIFTGTPGVGKNYVSQKIAESLYKEGLKSKFVHLFIGQVHFPANDRVKQYKRDLFTWIKGNLSKCEKQLFIFDDIDKISPLLLDGLKPLINHYAYVDRVNCRKSIFIFLNNQGGRDILQLFEHHKMSGLSREDMTLHHFESILKLGAFNSDGAFHRADIVDGDLIDHYIPFLPLEVEQVKLCVRDEFRKRGIQDPRDSQIEQVMKYITFKGDFAPNGCKRISHKVAMIVHDEL